MINLKKHIHNYKQPTPIKYRKMGDLALIILVTLQGIIAAAPSNILNEKQAFWIGSIITILTVMFKFWTNTKIHENSSI